MNRAAWIGAVSLLSACSSGGAAPTQIRATTNGAEVIVERGDSGGAFATLHTAGGGEARIPYVWPLVGPGGHELTRAFPMATRPGEAHDHPHHQSLWFSHGDVNGHDFWHDPGCTIRPTEAPTLEHGPTRLGGDTEAVTLELVWSAPERPEVLRERRVYRFGVRDGLHLVECESTLTASNGSVHFGDTKEGTFGLRVRPEMRLTGGVACGRIVNSEGLIGGECWGKRARWVAYEAALAEPTGTAHLAVCVMDHPSNHAYPTWWHARDYGLVAANPFGVHDFTGAPEGTGDFLLAANESLTQRYLVVLADGDAPMGASPFEALFTWWANLR